MDLRLGLMCGIDLPIPELQATIHQPKIKEIAFVGEKDFFLGVQCLCIDKNIIANQGESLLVNTNNFQIFMTMMKYKTLFTPRSIILQSDTQIMIDDSNFEILQEYLKEIFCFKSSMSQELGFNPANDTAKKIADKLMRGRQRVAELNGSANVSIFSQYLSMLTVGLDSMSLQDLMDLTMFQLFDLVERYQLYINWDIDIRSRLAGGKPDGKPENWMKNIH